MEPKTLSEKIRKAREFTKEVGGHSFTLRRPTEVEWFETVATRPDGSNASTARFLPFIIGWSNVIESDVLNGGDPHPLSFSESVRDEWLADRSDLFGPLITALMDEFVAYNEKRQALTKNSTPG